MTLPERALAASLVAAVTEMVAAPWPEVVASFNQEVWLSADQVQSRAADTVTGTAPPLAGTTVDGALIVAAQRTAPGVTTSVAAVDPQPTSTTVPSAQTTSPRAERTLLAYG